MESNILTVKVARQCLKTLPCKHNIVISYKDGTTEELVLSSPIIADKYWEFLSDDTQNHLLTEPSVFRKRKQYL